MTEPLFHDGFSALFLQMPLRALYLLRRYGAHVVSNVADADRLKQGHDCLVFQA